MAEKKYFRVLTAVRLHTTAGRKELNGVYRFLGEGHDWDMDLIRTETDVTPELIAESKSRGFDGLLIATVEPPELRRVHERSELPVSFIDYPDRRSLENISRCVFIHDDARSIVLGAVSHLLKCNALRHFAFVPTRAPRRWSDDRQKAFSNILKLREAPFSTYAGDGEDRDALTNWLRSLPKPAGIVAAFDDRAHDVLEACRTARLDVPRDVSVIGLGNDEQLCENTSPTLTSVAIDFEQQGYRAARELHAMMLRPIRPKRREILIGAADVVTRGSTTFPSDAAILVRRAQAYISSHATDGIGVSDVARHLRISRRLVDLRFRQVTGQTVHAAILTRRLEEAKRLLKETDRPVAAIARLCGYRDGNYFKNAFRREVGQSPTSFRKTDAPTPTATDP